MSFEKKNYVLRKICYSQRWNHFVCNFNGCLLKSCILLYFISYTLVLKFRCLCEFCQVMDRSEEFVCCQEVEKIKRQNAEAVENKELEVEPSCITQHPGFSAVCLKTYVLKTAWYQYRQQYGNRAYDGPQHKKNRHIAYRQFVRWCWGFLGKAIRVPLPSCVVCCIRAHFPPPGLEEDFHFTGFLFADE